MGCYFITNEVNLCHRRTLSGALLFFPNKRNCRHGYQLSGYRQLETLKWSEGWSNYTRKVCFWRARAFHLNTSMSTLPASRITPEGLTFEDRRSLLHYGTLLSNLAFLPAWVRLKRLAAVAPFCFGYPAQPDIPSWRISVTHISINGRFSSQPDARADPRSLEVFFFTPVDFLSVSRHEARAPRVVGMPLERLQKT